LRYARTLGKLRPYIVRCTGQKKMASISLYRIPDADLTNQGVDEFLSLEEGSSEVRLRDGFPGRLFTFVEPAEIPEWAQYVRPLAVRAPDIPARQAAGAVLLLKPDARRRLVYAATWGNGRFQLRAGRLQPDAGLRCALNLISGEKSGERSWNPARVRAVRSKRVSENTLITETQSSRKASIETFPFSADADQLRRVTGTPINAATFGSTITGGASIQVKRPAEPRNLITLCRSIERVHNSTDYQRHFAWIDNVSPIRDARKLEDVYKLIVDALKAGATERFNLSPPSLIEWEDVASFRYQWGRKSVDVEEPSPETFREFVAAAQLMPELTVEALQETPKLHALDGNQERIQSWPINRCLSGEFVIGADTYILDDGALLSVASDYMGELNGFMRNVPDAAQAFPRVRGSENEGSYNRRVALGLDGAILLDQRTVTRPRATAIEVCDVAIRSRHLVHVKKGTSSSSLSHLFAQGVVSAELLHMDARFRERVATLLAENFVGTGARRMRDFAWLHAADFQPNTCEVVYAIMTGPRHMGKEELPFFSKVNLRMRCHELRRMGFKYSLALVSS
jgi:uncharacterized protein (TIGR04141 family)